MQNVCTRIDYRGRLGDRQRMKQDRNETRRLSKNSRQLK